MANPIAARLMRWTEAPTPLRGVRFVAEYAALRLWALLISCFPVEANLATARLLGRIWWRLMRRHRDRALEHLRFALGDAGRSGHRAATPSAKGVGGFAGPALSGGDRYDEGELRRIARGCFEHFAQVYLVELLMTPRLVNEWSWARYVELGELGPALRELLGERGAILVTPHFGNFELMGYTICRLGLPLTAVMRPLDNALLNRYLERTRAAGGLTLLYKRGATAAAQETLERGGAICFIADQDAGRKGLFVDFFGREASTYKSIGLLAMQHRAPIIVGGAARTRRGFQYRIDVERIIQPAEWDGREDALRWITQEFSHAMEAAIRRHPEQYLWIHRRWKHRPKHERA